MISRIVISTVRIISTVLHYSTAKNFTINNDTTTENVVVNSEQKCNRQINEYTLLIDRNYDEILREQINMLCPALHL